MRNKVALIITAILGAVLMGTTPAHATGAAYVQGNVTVTNASSFSVSYTSNVTSGDLLVVFYRNYDDTGGYVTDTLDGTTHWTTAVNDCTGWDVIAYIVAPSSGADTVTIYSRQVGYARAAIMEYSGLTGTLMHTGYAQGPTECGTTNNDASVSMTTGPNNAGHLIVSGFTTTDNTTATAGTCGGDNMNVRQNENNSNGSIDVEDVLSNNGNYTTQTSTLTWGEGGNGPKWFADTAEFE